ncbi:MAG: hypothetical protein Q4A52_00640 [Bacillota bacterium]|nr:hypothetical protein [Bacillota bacterium]
MKKLISLLLVLALLVPVSFAGDYDEPGLTGGQHLFKYGMVLGDNGDLKEHASLTREQLAILLVRLYGETEQAKAYQVPSGFADEAQFPGWSKQYISYAKMKGWMQGRTSGKFDNLGKVTGEELATVLLRVLKRQEKWGTNIGRLESLGVTIPAKQLTRGETFDAMWKVVSTPLMSDGSILGVNLGKLQPKETTPASFDVASVKADNLKEVLVEMNQAVQLPDASAKAQVLGQTVQSLDLLPDGKTLAVRLATELVNQREYNLKLTGIKAVKAGVPTPGSFEKKFTVLDASMPSVTNVQFIGPKHLLIEFDEPIKTLGKVEIKQGNVTISVNHTKTALQSNKIVMELYSNLAEGKEYGVSISEFKDFAGYSNKIETRTLPFAKDTTAPIATVVSANNSAVVIRFSKPVKGAVVENFAHSFPNYHPAVIRTPDGTAYDPAKFYHSLELRFFVGNAADRALPSGSVKFMVFGKAGNRSIVDAWGNVLADASTLIQVEGENSPLTASITAKSGSELEIKFSKPVLTLTSAAFRIKKSNGANVPFTAIKVSDDFYKLNMSTPVSGQVLTVEIVKAVDASPNAIELKNFKLDIPFGDTEKPDIVNVAVSSVMDGANEIARELVINFRKDDTSADALSGSKYRIHNDVQYHSLSAVNGQFASGNKTITFRLDKASTDPKIYALLAANGVNKLLVDGVADNAGNVMDTKSYILQGTTSLELYVDEIYTFDRYQGAQRPGLHFVMTGNVAAVGDINTIVPTVNLKFGDVEFDGTDVYLFAADGYKVPNVGGFQVQVPAGVFTSDIGRPSVAEASKAVVDRIKPAPQIKNGELDLMFLHPNTMVLLFTEPLKNSPNIDSHFVPALRLKLYTGGQEKDLLPTVDYTLDFDVRMPETLSIQFTAPIATGDQVIVEWIGSQFITDANGNPLDTLSGTMSTVTQTH